MQDKSIFAPRTTRLSSRAAGASAEALLEINPRTEQFEKLGFQFGSLAIGKF